MREGKILPVSDHLHDVRQDLDVALGLIADGQHPPLVFLVHGGDGQQNALDLALLHNLGDVLGGAHDLDAHDVAALLFRRIVHTADDVHIRAGLFELFMQKGAGRIARTDQQGTAGFLAALFAQLHVPVHPVHQAGIHGHTRREHGAEEVDRKGHLTACSPENEHGAGHKQKNCNGRAGTQPEELYHFGVTPQTVVHTHQAVDDLEAADEQKTAGHQQAGILCVGRTSADQHPGRQITDREGADVEQHQDLLAESAQDRTDLH